MLPDRVQIGAHKYDICIVERDQLGEDTAGDINSIKNRIRIVDSATRSRQIEILLHECLHGMLAGHNFEREEEIVVILGEGLTSFISDNPSFFEEARRILADEKKSLENT